MNERKYKRAYEMLSKRQSMSSKCAEILEMLSTKLSEVTTTTTTMNTAAITTKAAEI